MAEIKEFEAQPHEKLELPKDLEERLHYKVIYGLQPPYSVAWCNAFEDLPSSLRLFDVLIDTSERHQGITLKKRLTYRDKLILYHMPAVIFPLEEEA